MPPLVGWLYSAGFEPRANIVTGLFAFAFVSLVVARQAVNYLDAIALGRQLRAAYRSASRARAELNRLNGRLVKTLAEEQERATFDTLTGVLNRGAISNELNTALKLAGDRGGCCAVGVVDINSLKNVNDQFGHLAGDEYIKNVAKALQAQNVQVGRYGGDEFVVILPGADVSSVRTYARDVRSRLITYHDRKLGHPNDMISIGFALCPQEGRTPDELLRLADARMYVNKVESHTAA